jgi:hypothetical protein
MAMHTLGWAKDGHRYLFRYPGGAEHRVVEAIMDAVEDERLNLDWPEAAVLSYQVTRHAVETAAAGRTPPADHSATEGPCLNQP